MWAEENLSKEDIYNIVRDSREYALTHGLVLRYKDIGNDNRVGHTPFTLFPTPFPRRLYDECLAIQPIHNKLLFKIANDVPFMITTLETTAKYDDFTRELMRIAEACEKAGNAQPLQSCINRSDYMLDRYHIDDNTQSLRLRQVEINAIASGMSSQSYNCSRLHDYVINKYNLDSANRMGHFRPPNEGLSLVADGLIDAYNHYGKSNTYIMTVIEPFSNNFADHLFVELTIAAKRPDIRVVRAKFNEFHELIKLGPNNELMLNGKEIAVVYFRYCYDSSHYMHSSAWASRLMIELSNAIKCPSGNFHLAGAKKFQQVLSNQRSLEKFLDPNEAARLARIFCKLWPLDDSSEEGKEGYQLGLKNYENMVMKPQKEGGGHNFFGEEIVSTLRMSPREELAKYILMEYINSPSEKNWILTERDPPSHDSDILNSSSHLISEIGIYGSILADQTNILSNKTAGYLVRSKHRGVKENGVACGFAGVSSLLLIDDTREDVNLRSFYDEDLSIYKID